MSGEEPQGGEARPHGLPGPLPQGERVLWQGSPNWRALAWRAFHIREVAIYFGLFGLWRAANALATTGSVADAAASVLAIAPFALGATALLGLLAFLTSRYAVYTLTDRRVVLSTGVALTATINLPVGKIVSADLKASRDGTGDISLGLSDDATIAFANLWPHARPWRLKRPEPTLRAIANPEHVADLLLQALAPGAHRVPAPTAEASAPRPAPAHALAS